MSEKPVDLSKIECKSKNGRFFKGKIINCAWCGKEIYRKQSLLKRAKIYACSKSCSTKYTHTGKSTWNKGKKLHYPVWNKGKNNPLIAKEKHHNWKGGVTPLLAEIRNCKEYRAWRSFIFKRDNFTCQICGQRKGNIEADHYPIQFSKVFYENNILSLSEAVRCKELWDVDNGRTLCKKCHKQYGKKNNMKNSKRIVIFGASGYLGTHLVSRLIENGKTNIVAVARNEAGLVALNEKFSCLKIIVGDISDPWVVKKAMRGAREVFLLSALKHVGLAEVEVKSCITTNIIGAMNVIDESLITKPKVLMFISTDKASQPMGVYGCSKKIGEKLIKEAEEINKVTKYRIVRYGNVWNSAGSLITKWRPKMLKGEEIILTEPEASRFFWTVEEAVDLIFECIEKAKDSTPYIPKMKAIKMSVVLDACLEVYNSNSPVKIIGLQPGENMVETTDGITFSDKCEQFTKEEFIKKFLYEDKLLFNNKIL